jgi:ABC-2 type transport system ATP-binding protein
MHQGGQRMSTILECKDLTKQYGKFTALDHITLSLEGGHIVGLLGPNGSGKTTLIKIITGLLTPSSGEITVNGNPIGAESKKIISYLPDHTYLNKNMRVRDIIDYFEDFYTDFDTKRAYDMLAKLSINPSDRLKTMSKGTKEKVQLILVMSRHADLYVLDEPIAGVDPAARDYILNTILSNYDENATILISTHLIADIENILDQIIFIQNGHIRLNSSVEEIREQNGKSIDTLFREVFRC